MTYQLTSYGVDEHIALIHIGHVILNSHLLPVLKETSRTDTIRLVTLGSNLHESAPSSTKFASLDELNTDLGPNAQYARSKLAVMLYARYMAMHLSKTHPNILVSCVHLGIVETTQSTQHIHEAYPVGSFATSVGLNPLKKDQFQGAVSAMLAATKTEKTRHYICPPVMVEKGSTLYNSDQLMENLMSLRKKIVQEKVPEANLKGCPLSFF